MCHVIGVAVLMVSDTSLCVTHGFVNATFRNTTLKASIYNRPVYSSINSDLHLLL